MKLLENKSLTLFFGFLVFLAVCVYLFKDTETFQNLSCLVNIPKKNKKTTTTTKIAKSTNTKTNTKSECLQFIEKAENGEYNNYNECYGDCVYLDPSKDARLYCGNGSECDAFCFNQVDNWHN